jgi:Tfp pilus assembly protein FimV
MHEETGGRFWLACQCITLSSTGSTASLPASGSRMMLEKKPEAALLGVPGAHADRRQADADAVEKPFPRVVGEQELADAFCVP